MFEAGWLPGRSVLVRELMGSCEVDSELAGSLVDVVGHTLEIVKLAENQHCARNEFTICLCTFSSAAQLEL